MRERGGQVGAARACSTRDSVFSVTYPTAGIVKAQRKESGKRKRLLEGKDVNDSYKIFFLVSRMICIREEERGGADCHC